MLQLQEEAIFRTVPYGAVGYSRIMKMLVSLCHLLVPLSRGGGQHQPSRSRFGRRVRCCSYNATVFSQSRAV